MSVGEFTSSNIAASMDHSEKEQSKSKNSVDLAELKKEVDKQKQLAKEVSLPG